MICVLFRAKYMVEDIVLYKHIFKFKADMVKMVESELLYRQMDTLSCRNENRSFLLLQ